MPEPPLVNLSSLATPAPEARNPGLGAVSEGADSELSVNLRLSTIVRHFLYLRRVPHGQRVAAMRQAAFALGTSLRSLYRWRDCFWRRGIDGLRAKPRLKAERPKPTTYQPEVAEIIRRCAPQVVAIRQFYRALGSPASYESLRYWVRFYQSQAAARERSAINVA